MKCAECGTKACGLRQFDKAPDFCPMKWDYGPQHAGREGLSDPKLREFALNAARTESAGYCRWTRLEETMEFAIRCGYKRLGVAFCSGLREEAAKLVRILKDNNFEVYSAICCCGGVQKEEIGLKDEEKVRPGNDEVMCNPIGQAHVLAKMETEFNVVVGLCVGHDSLFLMNSKAPATVLVAKDRVLAHNPVGAIYASHSYYRLKVGSHKRQD